jgi:outer membrane protein assembly factor BamB
MPLLLCLLFVLPPAAVNGDKTEAYTVPVLFYYGPEEYYWGKAVTGHDVDAIDLSMAAADGINRGFAYDNATGAVEIGGLRPGINDTWKWALLSWDSSAERWAPWAGSPHGLWTPPGGAVAWSPNDTANPTPNPLSRYPWPMGRCTATGRGETLSPAPLTNLTFWKRELDRGVFSDPCVAAGRVFVLASVRGSLGPTLFCLDELGGGIKWQRELGGGGIAYHSSPAYANGRVFVVTNDSMVRAVNAFSGEVEWTFDTGAPDSDGTPSLTIARDRLLVSTNEGHVFCLGLDGRLAWMSNVGGSGVFPVGEPAILGDKVVVGTPEGRLVCLHLENGTMIWNLSLSGTMVTTPALSSDGYVFVLASYVGNVSQANMTLYSFFLRDGVQQWNATYPRSFSSPALSAGGLFLGTGTEIVGHHPDRGTKVWGIPYGEVSTSPAVARGYVYFATDTDEGIIGCVRVGGSVEWTFAAGNPVFASPAVADGRLFVVTTSGTVLCLGRPPEPRVGAKLSAPAKAAEGDKVEVKASLNNTGEAPALFTLQLTLDGNLTGPKKGPFELQPGERMNVSFEWRAAKGNHTFGLFYNGTNGTFTAARIEVGMTAEACSSVIWTTALAGCALLVPSVVKWRRRHRP